MDIEFKNHLEGTLFEIPRSEQFYSAAKELSKFIMGLPLTCEQNGQLIDLILEQVRVAERGAFGEGLKLGSVLDRKGASDA